MRKKILLALISGALNAGLAHAADAALSKVPLATADADISCESAERTLSATAAADIAEDDYNRNMATLQKCRAQAINARAAREASPQRVLATARYDTTKRVMVFGLISVDPRDADGIKQICSGLAQAVGARTGDPTAMAVISAAGEATCASYVDAALRSDPLLIVAPSLVPGIAITKSILRRAGVSDASIAAAEHAVAGAATKVASASVRTGVRAVSLGVVRIDPDLKCVTLWTSEVCR